MVLPLLTSLEVRLTPRGLYLRDEKLKRMVRDDGRVPVPYNVSIFNTGDGAVRIIGKKWTVRSHGDGTQIIEGDELRFTPPVVPRADFCVQRPSDAAAAGAHPADPSCPGRGGNPLSYGSRQP